MVTLLGILLLVTCADIRGDDGGGTGAADGGEGSYFPFRCT